MVIYDQTKGEILMKLRIAVTGIAEIEVPKELENEDIDTIWDELQDNVSDIDCGELYNIDSEPFDLEEE